MTTLMPGDVNKELAKDWHKMITTIEQEVLDSNGYTGKLQLSPEVMQAMRMVPRHEFLPSSVRPLAFQDRALSIDCGQTISQPYIVALMTDLADVKPGDNILEIGTGSGYQSAVLASLVSHVYSVELIELLAEKAEKLLSGLGYNNISIRHGNGYAGWSEKAPFDAIVVTAGGEIPPLLLEQLKPGGKMVIPVGNRGDVQCLTVLEKTLNNKIINREMLPVRFVPLVPDIG